MGISKSKLGKSTKDELVQMVLDLRKDLKESQARVFNYTESNDCLKEDLEILTVKYSALNHDHDIRLNRLMEARVEYDKLSEGVLNNIKRMA